MACIPQLLGLDEDIDDLLLELVSVCERVNDDPSPLEYETYDVGGDSLEVVEDPSLLEGDNEDVVVPDDDAALNRKGVADGDASASCVEMFISLVWNYTRCGHTHITHMML
jgi:hypothetical protein